MSDSLIFPHYMTYIESAAQTYSFPQKASTNMTSSSVSSPVDKEDEHQTVVMAVANARHET
jgi:hypothetical protein